ncbi:protein kinase-like [Oryza sativa Japonica Group]|uniref:Protein kinase-like n=1 Tax=Oryza sativa subsp. japonica TaxID=39947 RepID=Q5N9K0_ORYSJ|nr:protein kinase-like [Oryza sativa Japonica Group]
MASLPFAMASVHKCVVHVAAATADFSSHCLTAAAATGGKRRSDRRVHGGQTGGDDRRGKQLQRSDRLIYTGQTDDIRAAHVTARLAVLGHCHHAAIARLLGVSASPNGSLFLAYELLLDASPLFALHRNPNNPSFTLLASWQSRLKVAADVTDVLHYVHLQADTVHLHNRLRCVAKDAAARAGDVSEEDGASTAASAQSEEGGGDRRPPPPPPPFSPAPAAAAALLPCPESHRDKTATSDKTGLKTT